MRFHCVGGILLLLLQAGFSTASRNTQPAFVSSSRVQVGSLSQAKCSQFQGKQLHFVPRPVVKRQQTTSSRGTELNMFMGSDGGILGVGGPEVFTILLVGYFVLGPSDLYKVVKEVGKFIQNFRTLGTDLTKTVENNFESQLELEEIRKAQRELNDAFNFRRTINTEVEAEAFSTTPEDRPGSAGITGEPAAAAASAASATAATADGTVAPKKKIRRRVKKTAVPVEEPESMPMELSMPPAPVPAPAPAPAPPVPEPVKAEDITIPELDPWFEDNQPADSKYSGIARAEEQDRFAAQLSGNWNEQVMANEDKLSPLSKIMERLAILEEEKNAADSRLEEEFRLRGELEEKYYREKRDLLEEAAAEVQADAYGGLGETTETKGTK
mmetsp:Transcript_7054/g.10720  ORF Transcript_7054/g.10720 Transcript_7054/m.10720 type:complete len:384 (-) Transcript_7054:231-1382(-)